TCSAPCTTPEQDGMLIMDTAGRIFGYGTQDGHGAAPWPGFGTLFQREQVQDASHPGAPTAAAITLTPTRQGDYLLDSQGRVFGFGDASFGVSAPVQPTDYGFQGSAQGVLTTDGGVLVINSAGQIYGIFNPNTPAFGYNGGANGRFDPPFVGIAWVTTANP